METSCEKNQKNKKYLRKISSFRHWCGALFVICVSMSVNAAGSGNAQCLQEAKVKTLLEKIPDYLDKELVLFKKEISQQKNIENIRKTIQGLTYRYMDLQDCQKTEVGGAWTQKVLSSIEKKVSVARDRIKELTPQEPHLFDVKPSKPRGLAGKSNSSIDKAHKKKSAPSNAKGRQ